MRCMRAVPGVMVMCGIIALLAATGCASEPALVAHWPLSDGRGSSARDTGPGGLNGEIRGARWERYGTGYVLAFDGVDDRVRCGSPQALDIRGPITLSAWVWPEEVPSREVGIAGKLFTSYLLTYYSNGLAYWYIGDGSNHCSAGLDAGRWSHLVGTFDGERLRLYVNGALAMERQSKFREIPHGADFFIGCFRGDPSADDANYSQDGFFKGKIADVRVYARAMSEEEIAAQYEAGARGRFAPVLERRRPIARGVTIGEANLRATLGEGGGIELRLGPDRCIVESEFSFPAEQTIGWNVLSDEQAPPGAGAWLPAVRRTSDREAVLEAMCRHYSLRRTLRVTADRLTIEDTLTNHGTEPVGIIVHNKIIAGRLLADSYVGSGAPDPIIWGRMRGCALGVAAEDFVSRINFAPYANANVAGYKIGHFALDAGRSHTIKWSIYLLTGGRDRYDFVNRVREDWGANHTLLGPTSFFNATDPLIGDPAGLQAYLARRKLGVAMISPWLDYDPGAMDHVATREEYKELVGRAARALRAASPGIKVIGCIETDWVTLYPERMAGGEKLPVHSGAASGHALLTPEQAKVILDSDLPWKDSIVYNESGQMRVELYTRGGKPQIALNVIPGPGNYQERFLLDQARFLVEEVGLDGFYIDEFSPFWYRNYSGWDGYSADIDPATGRITRKYIHPAIHGLPSRLKLLEYVRQRNLVMVANTYAATTEETRYPAMRFAETVWAFDCDGLPASGKPPFLRALASSQLGTPIGLGMKAQKYEGDLTPLFMRGIVTYLRHGMVYYHYVFPDLPEGGYGAVNRMFPITPLTLFEGGIIGKERIVTCVSGTYEWTRQEKPSVHIFDAGGREKATEPALLQTANGWEVELQLEDWKEVAIIE